MSIEMAWLRWFVSASDLNTGWFTASGRPAKSLWNARILFQISSRVEPPTMLVAVIAPGFTMAFISLPLYCSTATIELNARSEERRVGKGGGAREARDGEQKK